MRIWLIAVAATVILAGCVSPNAITDYETAPMAPLHERLPGTEPYIAEHLFQGRIDCGAKLYTNSLNGCGVWSDYALGNTQTAEIPIARDNVTWIQNELVWQPTSNTAATLCTFVLGNPAQIGPKCGAPGWTFSYSDDQYHMVDLTWFRPDEFHLRVMPGDLAPEVGGIIVDQAFSVYTHSFYFFHPDDGWTYGADGPHEVPA